MYKKRIREAQTPEQRTAEYLRRAKRPRAQILMLLGSARHRARERGIEFKLSPTDIIIPPTCPVLGMPLFWGKGAGVGAGSRWASPSLDRIDNSKGYTPENVRVISYRANRIKNDATLAELRALVAYLELEGCR